MTRKRQRRVLIVIGSRAEYARYRSIAFAIREHPDLELQVVATGAQLLERFGSGVTDILADGFDVDETLYQNIEGENLVTMAKSTGHTIVELASAISRLSPDIALVMGDRFEAFAFAATAAMMNVHVAHVQGGEVTGTIDESLRHAITKLSHFHFPATQSAHDRIVRLGEDPDTVFLVGCPAVDSLLQIENGDRNEALALLEPFFKVPARPDPNQPYLLVVFHPVTTEYDANRHRVAEVLAAVDGLGHQAIMLWPNIDAGSDEISIGIRHFLARNPMPHLFMFKHFPQHVFVPLLAHADCVVGNSSAGIREACYFGTPVVNVGSRQHGRERGQNVIDVPATSVAIIEAVKSQLANGKYPVEMVYGDGSSGRRIADTLATEDLGPPQKRIAF